MSFKNLKLEQLRYAAEFFDVPVEENETKAQIIAALEEANISWSNYKKFAEANGEKVEDDTEEKAVRVTKPEVNFNETVLLKMDRQNPTFEILGRKFTKTQPFQVMSADDAQKIIDAASEIGGGFRIATPAEARSYFG